MKKTILILGISMLFACSKTEERAVDVLVIGGTTSGTSAGISAARLGVQTLIVEETPMLGGMFTSQGVGACDGNHNLHSGIWNEFRQHLRNHYGGAGALSTGWVSNTLFEPHVGDSIFKKMAAAESKLDVIYGYHYVNVIKDGNKITGAEFANTNKDKLIVKAKVVIDASDIGLSLKDAGADYRLGMDSREETGEPNAPEKANDIVQDLTWVAILKDYGPNTDRTIMKPEGYNPENFKGCCDKTVDGHIIDCEKMLTYGKLPGGKYMINWPKFGNDVYLNVIELSREDRNKALEYAKNYTLQFVYYIQSELGYKHLGLADDEFNTPDSLAYAPYHREGRRLKGMAYFTYNHVADPYKQNDPLYRTGISVGDYPVDHHHAKNPNAPDVGFPPVPSFNIPLGSLIPETVDGLIVSDKAISVTNLINGSTRLQPVVLLTGQAAGTLAALAVQENKQPREVNIRKVQSQLLKNKAYIMPLFDVNPDDDAFEAIQIATASGILPTKGEAFQWANRTWFYPDSTISVRKFTEGLNQFDPSVEIVEKDTELLNNEAKEIIGKISKTEIATDKNNTPISRRELAILLEKYLQPFNKQINHKGRYL